MEQARHRRLDRPQQQLILAARQAKTRRSRTRFRL